MSGNIKRAFIEEDTYFSEPMFEGDGGEPNTAGIPRVQGYLAALATRAIIAIEADNPNIWLIAFVGIGMDKVSTCEITVKEGQHLKKGDGLGCFHFGGSIHCLLFSKETDVQGLPEVGRQENVPVRGQLAHVQ